MKLNLIPIIINIFNTFNTHNISFYIYENDEKEIELYRLSNYKTSKSKNA